MASKESLSVVDHGALAEIEKPTRDEAEAAVRTLIRWAGDDPDREGLKDTPARVVRSYEEFFSGYSGEPKELLERTFEEVDGYDEIVLLRDIRFESHCEHHMAPIIGKAHVAYLPHRRVVGISKLDPLSWRDGNRCRGVTNGVKASAARSWLAKVTDRLITKRYPSSQEIVL